jgi:hypothetical protein
VEIETCTYRLPVAGEVDETMLSDPYRKPYKSTEETIFEELNGNDIRKL